MTLSCGGATHTELDMQGPKPGFGTLTLLVGGVERQTLSGQWSSYAIQSVSGAHEHTFRVQTTVDTQSAFVIDSFVFK
jgi:hypothetical protein